MRRLSRSHSELRSNRAARRGFGWPFAAQPPVSSRGLCLPRGAALPLVVLLASFGCIDWSFPPLPNTPSEDLCTATIVNEFGHREAISSRDPEFCPDGECPRFFSYCEYGADGMLSEWGSTVAELVSSADSFRGHPGEWCITNSECRPVGYFDGEVERPECPALTSATPFEECAPGEACLSLSRGGIDFGDRFTGTASAANYVRVQNECEDAVEVVVDERVTCEDTRVCTQCGGPTDRACAEDFVITTDCLPEPGRDSYTLVRDLADIDAHRCQIGVVFQPWLSGERRAEKIFSTLGGEQYRIRLLGHGMPGNAGLIPPDNSCYDSDHLTTAPSCTPGDTLFQLENLGPEGNVHVHDVLLPEDTGFRVIDTAILDVATGTETPADTPVSIFPGERLLARVRWCEVWSPEAGAANEVALLMFNTDDAVQGPSFESPLSWYATDCP